MAKKKKQQKKKNQTALQNQKGDFKLFLKASWSIIRNKSDTENYFTGAVLSWMISLFLNLIAIVVAVAAIYGLYDTIRSFVPSFIGIIGGATQLLLVVVLALLALILRGVANEVGRETDLNHLLALFSGITGFIALMVTLFSRTGGT